MKGVNFMIKNLGNILILPLTLLILSWSANLQAAQITDTESRFSGRVTPEHAAMSLFGWNESGLVYVVDYQDRRGYKINVYIDYVYEGSDRFPVHKASRMSLNSDEEQAFSRLFEMYDETKIPGGELEIGSPNSSNSHLNGDDESVIGAQSSSSGSKSIARFGTLKYYIPPRSHPSGKQFDAIQFMTDSQMRNMMYHEQTSNLSVWFLNSFNFVTSVFTLGKFNLKDVGLGYEIVFPNGSSVVAHPDPTRQTMVFLEGSGVDADDNEIPDPGSHQFADQQNFSSEDNFTRMHNYLVNFLFVQPIEQIPQCITYSSRVVMHSDGKFEIIARCMY